MIEILALPGWKVAEIPLTAWAAALTQLGFEPAVSRESPNVSWIEVQALRLRGYALLEDGRSVEAINFELAADDPEPAREALTRAAEALGWELHEDDEDDED